MVVKQFSFEKGENVWVHRDSGICRLAVVVSFDGVTYDVIIRCDMEMKMLTKMRTH